jgi:hypothetical protein
MILFGYYFAHARAANPIAEVDSVLVPIVIIEIPKSINQEICPAIVWKIVPFTFVPMVRNSAQKCSFELVNTPERFDTHDLAIRQPCTRFAQSALWVFRLAYFK